MERRLIEDYAALADEIRGYSHVKLANLEPVRQREARLLHDFAPQRYPRPVAKVEAVPVQVVHIQPAKTEQKAEQNVA